MTALKFSIISIVVIAIAYNGVYFKKLDEVKASRAVKDFNPTQYASQFWNGKLMPHLDKAIDITQLTALLSTDTSKAFDDYSHALGIGNLRYFLVKGRGMIESVNEDDIVVSLPAGKHKQTVKVATEYIFGNAVRDATGLIDINDFNNTMDFNNVSAELNKIIREQVLPSFTSAVKKGSAISFVGALELNKEHVNLERLEIIPVTVDLEK